MKRKLVSLLLFTLTVILAVFSGVGCQRGGKTTAKLEASTEDMIVMSIASSDGKANAFNALQSLQEQGVITFEYQDSTYGAYVTSINGKAEKVISSKISPYFEILSAVDFPSLVFSKKTIKLSSGKS